MSFLSPSSKYNKSQVFFRGIDTTLVTFHAVYLRGAAARNGPPPPPLVTLGRNLGEAAETWKEAVGRKTRGKI
jgi:hypothetical protein